MMASSYNAQEEDCYIAVPVGPSIIKSPVTEFKQRLPTWQPILTAGTVLPAFFVIWFIFIPIGIGLYITSNIKEFEETHGHFLPLEQSSRSTGASLSMSWTQTLKIMTSSMRTLLCGCAQLPSPSSVSCTVLSRRT